MNIQIFGSKKDNDTKKAQRFFKKEGTNLISSGGKIRGTTALPAI